MNETNHIPAALKTLPPSEGGGVLPQATCSVNYKKLHEGWKIKSGDVTKAVQITFTEEEWEKSLTYPNPEKWRILLAKLLIKRGHGEDSYLPVRGGWIGKKYDPVNGDGLTIHPQIYRPNAQALAPSDM